MQENLKIPAFVWNATVEGILKAPTLVGRGDPDTLLSRQDQEAPAAGVPGARLVAYLGGGHVFNWEVPARVAADLVAFSRGLRR